MQIKKYSSNKFLILPWLLLVILGVGGIIYTQDLYQNNKETVFLTKNGIKKYQAFQTEFSEKHYIVFKKEYNLNINPEIEQEFYDQVFELEDFCQEQCSFITSENMPDIFLESFKLRGDKHLAFIAMSSESDQILKELTLKLQGDNFWNEKIKILGTPYTNLILDNYSKSIKTYLFPALFIGIALCLALLYKSLWVGILLFFPCLMSASLSLFLTKIIFIESNLIISIIPLLMFVINLALVFHLYCTWRECFSFEAVMKQKFRPIYLMILTTVVGFASLYLSDLKAIADFGLLSSVCIFLSSILTIIWFKLIDKLFSNKLKGHSRGLFDQINFQSSHFFSYKIIITLCSLGLIIGLLTFNRVEVITDANRYFPKNSGITKSMKDVSQTVLGLPLIEVILRSDKINIKKLKEIETLEKKLNQKISEFNLEYLSLNKLIKKANFVYTKKEVIPDFEISYQSLTNSLPAGLNEGFPYDKNYRITVYGMALDVDRYEDIISLIKETFKSEQVEFNGLFYHLMVAQKAMIQTLIKSFLASLLIISIIAFIAFKSIRVFFLFLFVNIIPVFISFPIMYMFGLSFNIATVMTYSISLGLIVDSSFHLIHILAGEQVDKNYYHQTVAVPILSTSILLIASFLLFGLNSFLPIRQFGLCLSLILFLGLVFDLKILPTLFLKREQL